MSTPQLDQPEPYDIIHVLQRALQSYMDEETGAWIARAEIDIDVNTGAAFIRVIDDPDVGPTSAYRIDIRETV